MLAGRLLPIFGEIKLLGVITIMPAPIFVFASIVMFAISTGFLEPASRGLISLAAGPRQ